MAAGDAQHRVAMQQAELERQDVLPHAAHGFQEGWVCACMSLRYFRSTGLDRLGRKPGAVKLLSVVQDGWQASPDNVGADAVHHALRRQGLAKHFFRQFPAARGHDVALGA